jgi:SulP family sulfate permease
MIGIPFGVSYFPMGWGADVNENNYNDKSQDVDGKEDDVIHVSSSFPLPAKETVGIRMFLFATIVGQIVFTFGSGFNNPIGLQMVENIGFTKELSTIVIDHVGYGVDALATLIVIFGLSSILVGLVFFILGRLKLGSVVVSVFIPTISVM